MRGETVGPVDHLWKSAGMLKLSRGGAATLAHCLRQAADADSRKVYYDDVIGANVGRFDLRILPLEPTSWVEIDDLEDMAQARRLFEAGRKTA